MATNGSEEQIRGSGEPARPDPIQQGQQRRQNLRGMMGNALASMISGIQPRSAGNAPTGQASSAGGRQPVGYSAMGSPIYIGGGTPNGSATTGHTAFESGHGVGYPGGTEPTWQGRIPTAIGSFNSRMGNFMQGHPFLNGLMGGQQGGMGGGGLGSGGILSALSTLIGGLAGTMPTGGGGGVPGGGGGGTGGGGGGGGGGGAVPVGSTGALPGGYNAYTGQYGYSRNYGPMLGRQIAGEGPVLGAVRDVYRGPRRATFAETHGQQEEQY